jgi:DNA-binding transcriptional ArsR family regulator
MEKQDALAALAAIAQETRLDVFRRLVQAGPDGLAAGALAEAMEIPGATLSFHLKELKGAGVVQCRREGRSLIYSPAFDAMNALLGFLTQNCCEGGAACAPAPRRSQKRSTR